MFLIFRVFYNYKRASNELIHRAPRTLPRNLVDEGSLKHEAALLARLGSPQNAHPAIHVAGTSGKGTVCYLIDSLLRVHTKRTGVLVSPHVYDIRERIQINGQLISERLFAKTYFELKQRVNREEITYFASILTMGFLATSRIRLDYLVVETGVGGLWDTTNAISRKPKVCVLTQIGIDHTAILGQTLEKIASHKAGIIQEGSLVIALKQDTKVNQVFTERCKTMNAQLIWVEPSADYQETNDRLATTTVQAIAKRDHWDFDAEVAQTALKQAFIPGRFEKRDLKDHLIILDGAHNPQKLGALVQRIQSEKISPCTFIVAIGERKDANEMLGVLKPIASRIITTEFFTKEQDIPKRPLPAAQLAAQAEALGIPAEAQPNPTAALHAALLHPEPIVATGSFYLLDEIDQAF